jgi:hypothetical protein
MSLFKQLARVGNKAYPTVLTLVGILWVTLCAVGALLFIAYCALVVTHTPTATRIMHLMRINSSDTQEAAQTAGQPTPSYTHTATGPNGERIGSKDGGKTWEPINAVPTLPPGFQVDPGGANVYWFRDPKTGKLVKYTSPTDARHFMWTPQGVVPMYPSPNVTPPVPKQ